MKKWSKFFFTGFFSHNLSKEGVKRGYTNAFLGFVLALMLLWLGFVGGDMMPFGVHYNSSPDFMETAHSVFANADVNERIVAEIVDGRLVAKKVGCEYSEALLINTFESDDDKQSYSINGYNVVLDLRPASTLADFEAYCVSNDGKNTDISYQDYLTLSEVARLNFDFKLRYTGKVLELNDEMVEGYRTYIDGLSEENKSQTAKLAGELADNKITKSEYNRAIYELYFVNYYPEISEYESTSKVPLLRNYYYHKYISQGIKNYLLVFDDYMSGSFETKNGIESSFYGFYSDLENGMIVADGLEQSAASKAVDKFIKDSFKSTGILNLYAYGMNVISFVPLIALMLMVAALLTYSLLKLRGVESITTLGAMFKIVGSFVWVSGAIAAVITIIAPFFIGRNMINAWPLVVFFAALVIRCVIFVVQESKLYTKQLEEQESREVEA